MSGLSTEDCFNNHLQIPDEADSNPDIILEETKKCVDAVIKLIPTQINLKSEMSRRKRFCENMARPVMKLPREITTVIFRLLVNAATFVVASASEDEDENDSEISEPWWDWLIITKTCQSWRDIAISTPSFWTSIINFSNADKIEAFLLRSRNSLIDVVLHSKNEKAFIPGNIIDLFVGQVERMRTFEVNAGANGELDHWDAIWDLFTIVSKKQDSRKGPESLLRLTKVELRDISGVSPWATEEIIDDNITDLTSDAPSWAIDENVTDMTDCLPPRFKFQELRVMDVALVKSCPLLQGLSVLSLGYSEMRYPDVSVLFDILVTNPDLRSLAIDGILFTSDSHPERVVPLPQLKSIDISMDFHTCTYFFDCVATSLPAPTESEWIIYCDNYPFTDPEPFLPKLIDCGARCGADVTICFCDDDFGIRTGSLPETIDEHANVVCSTMFILKRPKFYMTEEEEFHSLFSTIETIMRQPFWSNLTHLTFDINITEDDELIVIRRSHWVQFLSSFPNIQHLAIEFPAHNEHQFDSGLELAFVEALIELINSNEAEKSTEFFSKLTCLRLNCANFSSKSGRRAHETFLNYLAQNGKQLHKLIVERCVGLDLGEITKLGIVNGFSFMVAID